MPKLALFDMDGTLFDHDYKVRQDLIKLVAPEEEVGVELIEQCDLHELAKAHPYIQNRIDLIRKQPNWWRTLPPYRPGFQIYHEAERIGFCCKILTKGPRSKPLAWMEKVECIHDHFGEEIPIDIVGKDKKGTYGRVLVDDYPDYMLGWLEHRPRGLGIMPAQICNIGFMHPNVIIYDGNNLLQVRAALQAAYDRESKEHWRDRLGE